jgi:hypothetical protein
VTGVLRCLGCVIPWQHVGNRPGGRGRVGAPRTRVTVQHSLDSRGCGKLSASVGLTFVVGDAGAALGEGFGASVDAALRAHFPQLSADEGEMYASDEVPVSGWRALQARVAGVMQAPQVTAIDIYLAVYVPFTSDGIIELPVASAADPLQIGSVVALLGELRDFASRASLPVDDVELMGLANRYLEDEELEDADLDIQTYVQLMLSAKQAAVHARPLWIRTR